MCVNNQKATNIAMFMKKMLLSVSAAFSLLSAQAAVFQYSVTLDGPSEPTASAGTGSGTVNYDDVLHTLELQVTFSGLTNAGSGTTASHIHAPTVAPGSGTAGVATTTPSFAGFPLGVTSGSFSNTLDLTQASSWNATFVGTNTLANAESRLAAAMEGGQAYWNIHSQQFGGGEIRGFLVPVPEPSTLALLGLGAGALVWRLRRKN
jgi:hypothetical protein